jgi:hypothetical protein
VLVFKPVDDAGDSFLGECDMEVDQQTEALVRQPEIREKIALEPDVNAGIVIDCRRRLLAGDAESSTASIVSRQAAKAQKNAKPPSEA